MYGGVYYGGGYYGQAYLDEGSGPAPTPTTAALRGVHALLAATRTRIARLIETNTRRATLS